MRCRGDNSCCTESSPCVEGDGDCDEDKDCEGNLVCGNNNCNGAEFDNWEGRTKSRSDYDVTDDCCMSKEFIAVCD